ncbi:MAG TPA: LacI family transcriptional regulator [Cytophagales bacterium]|jgi:LacI family transcriptional regulator|nr:LacI family transcriptional regulator [Cytophagales bacterium]
MIKKKYTIHDLARELDVTASTVSRALNDHPRISEKTKKKVFETARKFGYEPNTLASALRRGKSNTIGIIVPFIDRSFFASVIRGVEEETKKAGFHVTICQTHEKLEDEIQSIQTLLNARVSGMIISAAKESTNFDHLKALQDKGISVVLFDRLINSLDNCSVVIDDFLGAYKAVEHLIRQGYTRIAHFTGPEKISIYKERLRGYQSALEDYKLPINKKWIIEMNSQVSEGRKGICRLLKGKQRPDALFSSSDFSALGALQVLKEQNISVPDEFGIVGFSNEPFTQYLDPSLSSVDQNSNKMGHIAAKLLMEQINGDTMSDIAQKIYLKPELMIRQSSKRSKT